MLFVNVYFACSGRFTRTEMLVAIDLSKAGINLLKPGMNLLNQGENTLII